MNLQTLSLMRQFMLLPRKLGGFDRWGISEDEALVFSFPFLFFFVNEERADGYFVEVFGFIGLSRVWEFELWG
jgi:hypothetical protein